MTFGLVSKVIQQSKNKSIKQEKNGKPSIINIKDQIINKLLYNVEEKKTEASETQSKQFQKNLANSLSFLFCFLNKISQCDLKRLMQQRMAGTNNDSGDSTRNQSITIFNVSCASLQQWSNNASRYIVTCIRVYG